MRQLPRVGMSVAQFSSEEIFFLVVSECQSCQFLACQRELGFDMNKANTNGGAIALGHPLGVTGGRILHSAALELRASGKKYALVSMCIGVGQGYATILERV